MIEVFLNESDKVKREQLIAAQVAIFRNQDAEDLLGVDTESDEYHRLHEEYYALEAKASPWVRRNVWHTALYRHRMRTL